MKMDPLYDNVWWGVIRAMPYHHTSKQISLINIVLKYNFQSFSFINDKSYVRNEILSYFNDDGKLELFICKRYCGKINASVLFVECTELTWKRKYANRFCVTILFKDMV